MFDKDAIDAITKAAAIEQAANAVTYAIKSDGFVALPDNFTAHDLEKFMPVRRRARGVMGTSSTEAFAAYVGEHKEPGCTVFVSHKFMSATAVLDMGTPEAPGHAGNLAHLSPKSTAAYQALQAIVGRAAIDQKTAAEFLEDWSTCLRCFDGDTLLENKHAIAAVRSITIEGLKKVESNEEQLSASRSSFESVKATSRTALPTRIEFFCEPYMGFAGRIFAMRLGIRTGGNEPALTLRVISQEKHDEEMAAELGNKVTTAIGGTCPVLIGEYSAK